MIYEPSKNPKEAFVLVTLVVFAGIVGGYLLSRYIMAIALVFWIQYTLVLSYLQFSRKEKHRYNSFTEILLHPQIRFFIFEIIALWGIAALIIYKTAHIGAAALAVWWLFSLNFYFYYKGKKYGKNENSKLE